MKLTAQERKEALEWIGVANWRKMLERGARKKHVVLCSKCGIEIERTGMGKRKFVCFDCKVKNKGRLAKIRG